VRTDFGISRTVDNWSGPLLVLFIPADYLCVSSLRLTRPIKIAHPSNGGDAGMGLISLSQSGIFPITWDMRIRLARAYGRLILAIAGSILASTVLPSAELSLLAGTDAPSYGLTAQVSCENKLFRAARAKEITGGPEYQVLLRVASAFGRRNIPYFYIAEEGNNAAYIAGSASVDGKGKIVISRRLLKLLANTPALEGILAHEMAHLVSDDGTCGCDQWILRDPRQEKIADALAAKIVGYSPLRALFLRIKETQGGRSLDEDDRLQAIDALEMMERNQP
jgi:hypothetical protein